MVATADGIVEYAAHQVLAGVRLDTTEIAARHGIGRTTLFRRVGNREELMGEALWWLAARTFVDAQSRWDGEYATATRDEHGCLRCLRVMEYFAVAISSNKGFGLLLQNETAAAIRVLTDPAGRVQPRMIRAYVDLLERDIRDAQLSALVDVETLGYAIVRLGESIIYSDTLAGLGSTMPTAHILVRKLVEGVLVTPSRPGRRAKG
jgi:AcrR family transcriptional regulator